MMTASSVCCPISRTSCVRRYAPAAWHRIAAPPQRESKELERIETEAHRLDSMINDLLVMSRNQRKRAGQRNGESQSAVGRGAG
jgi:signal transduction histidine kinase